VDALKNIPPQKGEQPKRTTKKPERKRKRRRDKKEMKKKISRSCKSWYVQDKFFKASDGNLCAGESIMDQAPHGADRCCESYGVIFEMNRICTSS
jgi:hypothetical protein